MRIGSFIVILIVALVALGYLLSESINTLNNSEATQQPMVALVQQNGQLNQQIVIMLLLAFIMGVIFGVGMTRPGP